MVRMRRPDGKMITVDPAHHKDRYEKLFGSVKPLPIKRLTWEIAADEKDAPKGGESGHDDKVDSCTDSESESEPVSEPETKSVSESAAKPASKSKPKSVSESEAKPAPESEAKSASKSKSKPASESEAKPAPDSKPKPVSESEAKSASDSKPKPVSESETKSASGSEPNPKKRKKAKDASVPVTSDSGPAAITPAATESLAGPSPTGGAFSLSQLLGLKPEAAPAIPKKLEKKALELGGEEIFVLPKPQKRQVLPSVEGLSFNFEMVGRLPLGEYAFCRRSSEEEYLSLWRAARSDLRAAFKEQMRRARKVAAAGGKGRAR